MLLPYDSKPENSIYYSATLILRELKNSNPQDILELYRNINKTNSITLKVFAFCLDWLYLIEAATVDEKGVISICS